MKITLKMVSINRKKYYGLKKEFTYKIFVLLVSWLMIIQCSDTTKGIDKYIPSPPVKYGNVVFRVFDDSTHLPIPYVSIKLDNYYKHWGATGKSGISIMLDVQAKTYQAQFSAANYETHIEEVTIVDDDQIIDIYMHKNAIIDIIPPKILNYDYYSDPPNIYILFNEGMDKSSVLQAIEKHIWFYVYYDEYYGKSITVKSFSYDPLWQGNNLLIIKHEKQSFSGKEWELGIFRLVSGIALDLSGNVLTDSISIINHLYYN